LTRARRRVVVRRLLGLLLVALVVAGCSAVGSESGDRGEKRSAYDDGPYAVRTGPVLGVPIKGDPDDHAAEHPVVKRLIEMINHVPPRERIRIVTRSFSLHPVADALIDAHRRGVRVQVIVNRAASREFRAVAKMKDAFGTDRRKPSFIYVSRGSPRGAPPTRVDKVHQKTWTFTRVGDSRHVVMLGSANLSYYSTTQYSDMYTFVNRRDVWAAVGRDFRDQVGLGALTGPGYAPELGNDRIYFFPGWDEDTDPIRALIESLPVRDLSLRFAMYAWHSERGYRMAEAVAAKARAGAHVEVISLHIGKEIVRLLEDAGVEVHGARFKNGNDVHAKLSLLSWTDDQGTRQRRIVTGSDNFGSDSLPRDEAAAVIDLTNAPGWRAYRRWYAAIIARAEREGH